eukprot:m51a1_g1649 hypothetical protein (415) ;mRNA; r:341313-342859
MRVHLLVCLALACGVSAHFWHRHRSAYADASPEVLPHFKCGYDSIENRIVPLRSQQSYRGGDDGSATDGRKRTVSQYWAPIRVTLVTDMVTTKKDRWACQNTSMTTPAPASWRCTADDVLTDAKRTYLLETVLPDAVRFIELAYSVKPIAGSLQLLPAAQLPSCAMDSREPFTIATRTYNDSDLVIFVTARPDDYIYLAKAAACQEDTKGRAVAGHINFNPYNLVLGLRTAAQSIRNSALVHTAIHELHHVLGYNSGSFPTFIDPTIDRQLNYSTVITATAARIHFNCSSLSYIPLEDGGGSSTAGSHWEKRIFMYEFITGSMGDFSSISNITLATMHDSGWYRANWSMAEEFLFGKNMGCSFVVDSSGVCNLGTMTTSLPVYDQYFSDPTEGGTDELPDYCPYVVPYSTGNCA